MKVPDLRSDKEKLIHFTIIFIFLFFLNWASWYFLLSTIKQIYMTGIINAWDCLLISLSFSVIIKGLFKK